MYLAFDPGATTGWCIFNDVGHPVDWGQDSFDELIDHCNEWSKQEWDAIIYEQFKLFRHKAQRQTGSTMPASQAIGIIKTLIRNTGSEAIVQDASIKSVAEKWTRLFPPSDHSQSHWVDAHNHGAYYLINKGIKKTALEIKQEKEKRDGSA